MIERLRRALEHVDELLPEMQEEIAAQIEEMTEPIEEVAVPGRTVPDSNLPKSVRDALSMIGAWHDLQEDDEFEAFDRLGHESKPTPPIDLDDL
jgi:hypothetical protein